MRRRSARAALVLLIIAAAIPAHAAAIVPGFNSTTLARTDDGSTAAVSLDFAEAIKFFGTEYTQLFVNNNGNVTFDFALSAFTPIDLQSTNRVILAPFFADVDTGVAGSPVTYGTGTWQGRDAFGVNWVNVDYFASELTHTNRNSFQLVLVERFDTGTGNFDFIFNYDLIQWEAGEASSTAEGCGGDSARTGYANRSTESFELIGSGVDGAFVDSGTCVSSPGPNALILGSLNSNVPGRYVFSVRNGIVTDPDEPPLTAVPEPASLILLGSGLALLALRARSAVRR